MALQVSKQAPANRIITQQTQETFVDQNREGERTHQIAVPARCLSVTCPAARTLLSKPYQQTSLHTPTIPPTAAGQLNMLLPSETLHLPASAITAKLAHTCSNHFKASLTTCSFHPQTSRIVTSNKNGEMLLWDMSNGFKFVKQWTAHHMARLTVMKWTHNEQYCITGDVNGVVKYWKPTFEPYRLGLEGKQIHNNGGILGLAWAPTDTKFASASEDSTVCIWDLHSCTLHTRIAAHAGDCTSVDWHPTTSLLASASRDTLVKLWDARTGKQVTTYHGHQDRVNVVQFHWNGNWLLSGSRDATCKLFELRMNRELHRFTSHTKDINAIAWHPVVETLFVSGSADQSIKFWFTDSEDPVYEIKDAHSATISCMQWHPMGHLLASVGADAALKLWTRERPGDLLLGSVATGTIGQNQQIDTTPPGNLAPAADLPGAAAIPGLAPVQQQPPQGIPGAIPSGAPSGPIARPPSDAPPPALGLGVPMRPGIVPQQPTPPPIPLNAPPQPPRGWVPEMQRGGGGRFGVHSQWGMDANNARFVPSGPPGRQIGMPMYDGRGGTEMFDQSTGRGRGFRGRRGRGPYGQPGR